MADVGIGTLTKTKDFNPETYWEPSDPDAANTLYFDFGTAVNLNAFAIITGDGLSGTMALTYGPGYTYSSSGVRYSTNNIKYNSNPSIGTIYIPVHHGTGKRFFHVGMYRIWRLSLFDPQDLKEYDDSNIEYDGAATYDSFVFFSNRVSEAYLGEYKFFGEEPTYPFERTITYSQVALETPVGKRYDYHRSRKHSWYFDYSNVRARTKDNLLSFVGTTSGAKNPFWLSLSDDESSIFIGRINEESFTFNEIIKNVWNAGFDVEESK